MWGRVVICSFPDESPRMGFHSSGYCMDAFFRGRFEAKVDSKGRVAIPSALRSTFPQDDSSIVVTNSQFNGHKCLDLYLKVEWEKIEQRVRRLSTFDLSVQSFERFYLSGGQAMVPDGQGRILIPQDLRSYAHLEQETIFVGMGNKIEIWPMKVWNQLHGELAESFEQTMAKIAELDKEADKNKGGQS